MIQGTGSDVGKSVLVCGLCRLLHRAGIRVAPFKSQNMALNSYVTAEGLEMGRAQVAQAEAARIAPRVDMNPILLKPAGDVGSQVVSMGKPIGHMTAQEYYAQKDDLLDSVRQAYGRLAAEFDVVLIEGAGSPAEINLRDSDIVNMWVAKMAGAAVLLVVDIDRGGAFAWVAGTLQLLPPDERALVKGVIVNKFRGDVELLKPGLRMLEDLTHVPVLGVVPYFRGIRIDEEDSVCIERVRSTSVVGEIDVAIVRLPRISNFTDFDALAAEPGVSVRYVQEPRQFGDPDLAVIPGTKNTSGDLGWLHRTGLTDAILSYAGGGGRVVGICGGFQMLGAEIRDPDGVESDVTVARSLGLLPVRTTFLPEKTTHQAEATAHASSPSDFRELVGNSTLRGYEIHMGATELDADAWPLLTIGSRSGDSMGDLDGAISPDGRIWGTYLHGIFDNDEFRFRLINTLRKERGLPALPRDELRCAAEEKEAGYDQLADLIHESLDMSAIWRLLDVDPAHPAPL